MLQIDKLMRSNELNFRLMAALPVIVFFYAVKNVIFAERLPSEIYARIRNTMRRLHILLVAQREAKIDAIALALELNVPQANFDLDCVAYGRIMLALHRLHRLAHLLPSKQQQWFTEDLDQLERRSFSVDQRLHTISRMYFTYHFLSAQ